MATRTATRQEQPQTTVREITWPREARVLDPDGVPITGVVVLGPPRNGRLLIDTVDNPTALLTHHLGHSGQRTTVLAEHGPVEGWLATRWEGGRRAWWLELDT